MIQYKKYKQCAVAVQRRKQSHWCLGIKEGYMQELVFLLGLVLGGSVFRCLDTGDEREG